jgi:hypothetical protein
VQSALIDRLRYFNAGETYLLFRKLLLSLELFESIGFRNRITLLAALATPQCCGDLAMLFEYFTETDPFLAWETPHHYTSFLMQSDGLSDDSRDSVFNNR